MIHGVFLSLRLESLRVSGEQSCVWGSALKSKALSEANYNMAHQTVVSNERLSSYLSSLLDEYPTTATPKASPSLTPSGSQKMEPEKTARKDATQSLGDYLLRGYTMYFFSMPVLFFDLLRA